MNLVPLKDIIRYLVPFLIPRRFRSKLQGYVRQSAGGQTTKLAPASMPISSENLRTSGGFWSLGVPLLVVFGVPPGLCQTKHLELDLPHKRMPCAWCVS